VKEEEKQERLKGLFEEYLKSGKEEDLFELFEKSLIYFFTNKKSKLLFLFLSYPCKLSWVSTHVITFSTFTRAKPQNFAIVLHKH
jgi:ribosomal protein L24E